MATKEYRLPKLTPEQEKAYAEFRKFEEEWLKKYGHIELKVLREKNKIRQKRWRDKQKEEKNVRKKRNQKRS